jgi:uncharacterized membrane protein YqiK
VVFRDAGVAERARLEMLEAEVARLREENTALRSRRMAPPPARGTRGTIALLLAAAGLGAAAWYAGFVVSGRTAEQVGLALGVAATLAVLAAIAVALVARLLVIVPPHRVAVVIGRRGSSPSAGSRAFQFVSGGRVLRMPLIERIEMLPDGPFDLEPTFHDVVSRTGSEEIGVDVRVRARLSFPRHDAELEKAAERFLGRGAEDVIAVARETIEAAVRSLFARVDHRALADDLERAGHELTSITEDDLRRLGLALDTLHVLEIAPRLDGAA